MALQSLQITPITAMRARDVSRPAREQQEAADRRPLRDETPRREPARRDTTRGEPPRREAAKRDSPRHR
ncbi:hypothetical protein FHS43_002182 [Streptosporangium becharense]|uniref:Uncharacterized protein n=1 Tax=Streptosporangium becharense TaxID=1816182 RepID=A0A7W9IL03_9ACTN|nr:hypothetical protein [Streptosporangium becharense]MBB2910917.1 hypothetical protein [Streptosporangium becharense]MBB5822024.1 hypothetical protein [Streptosporangium becharense]